MVTMKGDVRNETVPNAELWDRALGVIGATVKESILAKRHERLDAALRSLLTGGHWTGSLMVTNIMRLKKVFAKLVLYLSECNIYGTKQEHRYSS